MTGTGSNTTGTAEFVVHIQRTCRHKRGVSGGVILPLGERVQQPLAHRCNDNEVGDADVHRRGGAAAGDGDNYDDNGSDVDGEGDSC